MIARRRILSWNFSTQEKRRKWLIQIRNLSVILFILGTGLIWGTELKTFAISIAAIAAAFVLATKELILCVSGGVLKVSNDLFGIGDWIQIGEYRGEVVDHSFLTTKLRQIGPGSNCHQFTGNLVKIPNSIFLSSVLINESVTGSFCLHTFKVNVGPSENIEKLESRLRLSANQVTESYKEQARRNLTKINKAEAFDSPSVDPRITIEQVKHEDYNLICRVVAPSRQRGKIEQEILRKYLF